MVLLNDVASSYNPKIIYGKKGEEVKIISEDFGDVLIVETTDGNRFSMLKNQANNSINEKSIATPDAVVPMPNINNKVSASNKKAAPTNQQSLF